MTDRYTINSSNGNGQIVVGQQSGGAIEINNHNASSQNELQITADLAANFVREGVNYESFKDRNPTPVRGTCKWIQGNQSYQQWVEQCSGILLLTAGPGCGKSVLARSIADQLTLKGDVVCHFFFKNDTDIQANLENALCALVHQLLWKFEKIPDDLKKEIMKYVVHSKVPDAATLWKLLLSSSKQYPRHKGQERLSVVCILDALDECEPEGRKTLLTRMAELCSNPTASIKLKFFLTSRPRDDVERTFRRFEEARQSLVDENDASTDEDQSQERGFSFIRIIDNDENKYLIRNEIKLVIEERIKHFAYRSLRDEEKDRLRRAFRQDNISATYLWVKLLFEMMEQQPLAIRTDEWLKLVESPPRTVDEMYHKILSEAKDIRETTTTLHIVLAARRPLSWREVDAALLVRQRPELSRVCDFPWENNKKRFEGRIRSSVGLFVTIHDDKLYFMHQTAREFLLRSTGALSQIPTSAPPPVIAPIHALTPNSIQQTTSTSITPSFQSPVKSMLSVRLSRTSFRLSRLHRRLAGNVLSKRNGKTWKNSVTLEEANKTLAEICMTYLCLKKTGPEKDENQSHLWHYAATEWYEHVYHSYPKPKACLNMFLGQTKTGSPAYICWSEWWSRHKVQTNNEVRFWKRLPTHHSFFQHIGYNPLMDDYLPGRWRITRDLIPSALRGVFPEGADHDIKVITLKDLMQYEVNNFAIGSESNESIESFFEDLEGMSPSLSNIIASNVLKHLCMSSRQVVGGEFQFVPEILAIWNIAPKETVATESGGMLLTMMAQHGNISHIESLLERGVTIDAVSRNGKHGTPLIAAIASRNRETFQYLLDEGLDCNVIAVRGSLGTALIAGCVSPDATFTRVLLDHGAQKNQLAVTGQYGTALIAAIAVGSRSNIDTLLERDNGKHDNIDVNLEAQRGEFGTALIAASVKSGLGLPQDLIKTHGALIDASAQCGRYPTALIAACATNNSSQVRQLLRLGADPNLTVATRTPASPLEAAVNAYAASSVLQLLNRGVDRTAIMSPFTAHDDGTVFGPIQMWSELPDEEAYKSAANCLRVAVILHLLSQGRDWNERDGQWITDASQCLYRGCDDPYDLQAAEITAREFGMRMPVETELLGWHKTIQAGAMMGQNYAGVLQRVVDHLEAIERRKTEDECEQSLFTSSDDDLLDEEDFGAVPQEEFEVDFE